MCVGDFTALATRAAKEEKTNKLCLGNKEKGLTLMTSKQVGVNCENTGWEEVWIFHGQEAIAVKF